MNSIKNHETFAKRRKQVAALEKQAANNIQPLIHRKHPKKKSASPASPKVAANAVQPSRHNAVLSSKPSDPFPISAHGKEALSKMCEEFEGKFLKILQKVQRSMERAELRHKKRDRTDMIQEEWRLLAIVCDRILLVLFLIATVVTAGVILLRPTIEKYVYNSDLQSR